MGKEIAGTLIVLIILIIIVVFAIKSVIKNGPCGGNCSSCGGNCKACNKKCNSHQGKRPKQQ